MKNHVAIYESSKRCEAISLTYILYKEERASSDAAGTANAQPSGDSYSLEIRLTEGGESECELLEDIAGCETEAMKIAAVFENGMVTPNTAQFIYEDLFPYFEL